MSQAIVRYCESCGKPLNAQARFCGQCGRPVPAAQPAQPVQPIPPIAPPAAYPPGAPGEIVVATLPAGVRRAGFLGARSETFVPVLTNLRIIFAKQTSQMLQEAANQAKEAAKQQGKGFLGQWGAVLGSSSHKRYLEQDARAILAEIPENFFVLNNQIRSIKVKENYDPDDVNTEVKLTIDAGSGKLELHFTHTDKQTIRQGLRQTLGNLVR